HWPARARRAASRAAWRVHPARNAAVSAARSPCRASAVNFVHQLVERIPTQVVEDVTRTFFLVAVPKLLEPPLAAVRTFGPQLTRFVPRDGCLAPVARLRPNARADRKLEILEGHPEDMLALFLVQARHPCLVYVEDFSPAGGVLAADLQ